MSYRTENNDYRLIVNAMIEGVHINGLIGINNRRIYSKFTVCIGTVNRIINKTQKKKEQRSKIKGILLFFLRSKE
jgi:hypothetical protein